MLLSDNSSSSINKHEVEKEISRLDRLLLVHFLKVFKSQRYEKMHGIMIEGEETGEKSRSKDASTHNLYSTERERKGGPSRVCH